MGPIQGLSLSARPCCPQPPGPPGGEPRQPTGRWGGGGGVLGGGGGQGYRAVFTPVAQVHIPSALTSILPSAPVADQIGWIVTADPCCWGGRVHGGLG